MLQFDEDVNVGDPRSSQRTCGNFLTEADACSFFDSFLERNRYFFAEKEVNGRLLFDSNPRDAGDGWNLRIDRILHPTKDAISAGWKLGSIGVEIKKSDIKVAGAIAQMLEHKRSLFRSRYLNWNRVLPMVLALFPARQMAYDLGSIFAQSNILSCYHNKWEGSLNFVSPFGGALKIFKTGIEIGGWSPSKKKGHRGSK